MAVALLAFLGVGKL